MLRIYEVRVSPVILKIIPGILFLILTGYVILYYHRMSIWDGMDLAYFLEKQLNNTLSFADLLIPHGGSHWHTGAYLILLPFALLSKWNNLYPVLTNLAFGVATYLVLTSHFRYTLERMGQIEIATVFTAVTAFFVFSLDQAGNYLFAWQVAVFMNLYGTAMAFIMLNKERLAVWHILIAMGMGLLAIYNFSTGLAILPIGWLMILFHPYLSVKKRCLYLLIWGLYSTLIAYHFFISILANGHFSGESSQHMILFIAVYILKYIGSPISRFATDLVIPFALLGILMFIWQIKHALFRIKIPLNLIATYISFGLYGILVALMTSIGRITFDTDQALVSRYISFSNFFWIGNLLLSFLLLNKFKEAGDKVQIWKWPARKIIVGVLILLFAMKTGNLIQVAYKNAHTSLEYRSYAHEIRSTFPDSPDKILNKLYPNRQVAFHYLQVMKDYHLNIFRKNQ